MGITEDGELTFSVMGVACQHMTASVCGDFFRIGSNGKKFLHIGMIFEVARKMIVEIDRICALFIEIGGETAVRFIAEDLSPAEGIG